MSYAVEHLIPSITIHYDMIEIVYDLDFNFSQSDFNFFQINYFLWIWQLKNQEISDYHYTHTNSYWVARTTLMYTYTSFYQKRIKHKYIDI